MNTEIKRCLLNRCLYNGFMVTILLSRVMVDIYMYIYSGAHFKANSLARFHFQSTPETSPAKLPYK